MSATADTAPVLCDPPTLAAWLAVRGIPDFEAEPAAPAVLAVLDLAMAVLGEELDWLGAMYEHEANRVCRAVKAIETALAAHERPASDVATFLAAAHEAGRIERLCTPKGIAVEVKRWVESQPRAALPGTSPPAVDHLSRFRRFLVEHGFTRAHAPALLAFTAAYLGDAPRELAGMREADARDVGRVLESMARLIAQHGHPRTSTAHLLAWLCEREDRLAALFEDADAADALQAEWLVANRPQQTALFPAPARTHQDPA